MPIIGCTAIVGPTRIAKAVLVLILVEDLAGVEEICCVVVVVDEFVAVVVNRVADLLRVRIDAPVGVVAIVVDLDEPAASGAGDLRHGRIPEAIVVNVGEHLYLDLSLNVVVLIVDELIAVVVNVVTGFDR